jgi:hypothetical protein
MNLLENNNLDDHIQIDENKAYYSELVGEDKKFKTNEDLARGKYEADLYIETLKRRQDQLREDYTKLREEHMAHTKLEELLNQRQQSNNENTNKVETPSYDPKQIESLVSTKIIEHETQNKQVQNFKSVQEKLIEHYGSNYQNVLNKQMTALGLDANSLNNMARTQPNVLIRALGLDTAPTSQDLTLPRSSIRTDQFLPKVEKRTWNYYQEIRQKDPIRYQSAQIQKQMHDDYTRLGTEFEDGDFNTM